MDKGLALMLCRQGGRSKIVEIHQHSLESGKKLGSYLPSWDQSKGAEESMVFGSNHETWCHEPCAPPPSTHRPLSITADSSLRESVSLPEWCRITTCSFLALSSRLALAKPLLFALIISISVIRALQNKYVYLKKQTKKKKKRPKVNLQRQQ